MRILKAAAIVATPAIAALSLRPSRCVRGAGGEEVGGAGGEARGGGQP